jgi:squalene-associated FAD-dependent desaturase
MSFMTVPRHIHVIGAGMAGLASALQLSLLGEHVIVYEAAPFAGGRCRSWLDRELDCRLDNGNHLVLSGNAAIHDYLELTNARATINDPGSALFPFADLETGERWVAEANEGPVPWWIFDRKRRVPGTAPKDYLSMFKILLARPGDTVAGLLGTQGALYRRFWHPFTIGALNTEPEIASARLLANILRQTFVAGGSKCHPLVPHIGLSETFVLPCLNVLRQHGVEMKYGQRLRSLTIHEDRVRELDFNGEIVAPGPEDWVVLALPAWVARDILPDLSTPVDFRSIINAHFRVEVPHNPAGLMGVIGGLAEWVFSRNGVASVTISAAERYADHATRDLATYVWQDLAALYDLDPAKVPPHKIFKEKYATFAATPQEDARRPLPYDFRWHNLALAGEWTATGLPSTIEGAIRSGFKAAQVVMRWSD